MSNLLLYVYMNSVAHIPFIYGEHHLEFKLKQTKFNEM